MSILFRWAKLFLLITVFVSVLATLFLSYRMLRLVERTSRPELSINAVYTSQNHGHPLALVVDYKNIGRTTMQWLGIKIVGIAADFQSTLPASSVTLANPTTPGVEKSVITPIREPARALALCARWLDEHNVLSVSRWYYTLEASNQASGRYSPAPPQEHVFIDNLRACEGSFP